MTVSSGDGADDEELESPAYLGRPYGARPEASRSSGPSPALGLLVVFGGFFGIAGALQLMAGNYGTAAFLGAWTLVFLGIAAFVVRREVRKLRAQDDRRADDIAREIAQRLGRRP